MTRNSCLAALVGLLLSALLTKSACAEPAEQSPVAAASEAAPSNEPEVNSKHNTLSSSDSREKAPAPRRRWYGGTILLTDLAALAMGYGAIAVSSSNHAEGLAVPLGIGAGLSYLAGGPIVHGLHGKTGTVAASLGIRLGIPLAGAGLGAIVGASEQGHCSNDDFCGLGAVIGGVFGFGAGMFLASIVDIAGLAYENDPNSTTPHIALTPSLDPKRGMAGLNLIGSW